MFRYFRKGIRVENSSSVLKAALQATELSLARAQNWISLLISSSDHPYCNGLKSFMFEIIARTL